MTDTYKLVCRITPNYTPLITQYIQKHTWEEYPFILKWREFMFGEGMYYLNGAHVYFDEFKTITLSTENTLTVTHTNKGFLEGFNKYVISSIGYDYEYRNITLDNTTDEYKKDMCVAALNCQLHGAQFDFTKFIQWYKSLNSAHIANMQKDPALVRATIDYDLSYRTFFV
jgi:hypothetical protein